MSPASSLTERLRSLVDAAREARDEGLVVSTSGNISVRLPDDQFAISAARTRLGRLTGDEIVRASLDPGESTPPPLATQRAGLRTSRETPMHRAVYVARPDVAAVLHCQSPAATLLGCRPGDLPDLDFIPEIPVYVGAAVRVPYLPPGSEELGDAVAAALISGDTRVVQLSRHGQLIVGADPAQCVERATFFEYACRLFVLGENGSDLERYRTSELELLRSYGRP